MLSPETRQLLTDALRPPLGYEVDQAIGTTYSLDLTAMLLAPLSFAMHDAAAAQADRPDVAALLDGIRRHAGRTTIFYQAGGLAVPKSYQPVFSYLEGTAHAVLAPQRGRVFHPKVWVLRFRSPAGDLAHRVLCLSRNLTFDRSWDTCLRLEEQPDGGIEPGPLASWLTQLPGLAVRPLPAARQVQLEDVVATVARTRFAVPAPFDAGEFLPLGLTPSRDPLVEPPADRVVVISPFLDLGRVRGTGAIRERTWISRPETLERVGANDLGDDPVFVLHQAAETDPDAEPVVEQLEGLHAKVMVLDRGTRAEVVTGSANATTAAWSGNVEFCVSLQGPTRTCGTKVLLAEDTNGTSLRKLLLPYEVIAAESSAPAIEELEQEIELWQRDLAAADAVIACEQEGSSLALELRLPAGLSELGVTRVAPAALAFNSHARTWAAQLRWSGLALRDVSPYLSVETTLERDGLRASRSCLIRCDLVGDPSDRPARLLAEFLRSKIDVLRLLVLLLGEPSLAEVLAALAAGDAESAQHRRTSAGDDLPIFELLIKALSRNPEALERVAHLREELRVTPELEDLLPDGFEELWAPVHTIWRETRV